MRVIVTGGGTGGHIYPALAIIRKIKEQDPTSEFLYIGTHNRMEKDIVPANGIPFKSIEIQGFNRKALHRNIKTISMFVKAIGRAKQLIKEFQPDIVIGVGGYVTAPVIYAAKKLGIKTLIHEQNSILGMSNRFLLKYADKVALSFQHTQNALDTSKCVYTGNPVSEGVALTTPIDKTSLGLTNGKKLILIVMGSLGSKKINEDMKSMLQLFNNRSEEVLFITGNHYYNEFKELKFANNIKIIPYLDNMSSLLKQVDVMISRAGATTISEIVALEVPTILIPSPYVTGNHQYHNAIQLVEQGAALMIEERDLKGDILVQKVDQILKKPNTIKEMKQNLRKMKVEDSATKIYELILSLTR